MKTQNYFYKTGVDICNTKDMFEFIRSHYRYYTLNSWNGLTSIANNVKLYNLNLGPYYNNAYELVFSYTDYTGFQALASELISDWEAEHPGYSVCFNGRSQGYLVLYNKNNNRTVIPEQLECDSYEEFKEVCKEWYGSVKGAKEDLRFYTKLVQDFDKLCDEIRSLLLEYAGQDLKNQFLDVVVDNFNYSYKADLEHLGITPLVASGDSVYLSDLAVKSRSLLESFTDLIDVERKEYYILGCTLVLK